MLRVGLHGLSRVGEDDVGTIVDVGCWGSDVGNEHVGQLVEGVRATVAACDRDRSTVHVHFSIADLVEPGPSKSIVAVGDIVGNGESVLIGGVAILILGKISVGLIGRAASDDAMDDFKLAVLIRVLVCGEA